MQYIYEVDVPTCTDTGACHDSIVTMLENKNGLVLKGKVARNGSVSILHTLPMHKVLVEVYEKNVMIGDIQIVSPAIIPASVVVD
jgi:hypothetical protein